jgi:2-polyprenyl-3-methyl-5-hydroxy-6-metoxy-1,4-benzoquinol methylase
MLIKIMITKELFRTIYSQAVTEVMQFWSPTIQQEIALHNTGWSPDKTNTPDYLQASWVRYWKVVEQLQQSGATSVCDVGGFWGAFPIALRKLGFTVSMTEALKYYSNTFTPLFDYIRAQGVTIHDYDPFDETPRFDQYDAVTVMAVLEHYPHSLQFFMNNMKLMLKPKGLLFIDVPNIAYFTRRLRFLRGITPLVSIENIYKSRVPFIGHHHEYTLTELHTLAKLSDFTVVKDDCFNYTPSRIVSPRSLLLHPVRSLSFAFFRTTREVLFIVMQNK